MYSPLNPRVGGVLSADIAVPQHERMQRFYAQVLGTGAEPLWKDDLTNNQGIPIIGLGEKTPAYADLPLHWMPHIQVADVSASIDRALELGARVIMRSEAREGPHQWGGLYDPSGVPFGLIPVVPPEAFPPAALAAAHDDAPQVGHIAWFDLTVPDAAASSDFYRQVIGWSVEHRAQRDEAGEYADFTLCGGDGQPAGHIQHARGDHRDLPPVWLIHLPVGDLAESLRRVEAEGGQVLKTTPGADGAPAFAAIQDPIGVSFALVQS